MSRRAPRKTPGTGRKLVHRRARPRGLRRLSQAELVEVAASGAKEQGFSFTAIRRHVFTALASSDRALTAKEIIESLKGVGAAQPPTAYRALDFLMALGVVRKVQSLNAYIALKRGPTDAAISLLVCTKCGRVDEIDTPDAIGHLCHAMDEQAFQPAEMSIEVHGECLSPDMCLEAQD